MGTIFLCSDNVFNLVWWSLAVEQISNIRVDKYNVRKSECKKLLGVKFDTRLTFGNHINDNDIFSRASRKMYALARVAPYMNMSKRSTVMNALFIS